MCVWVGGGSNKISKIDQDLSRPTPSDGPLDSPNFLVCACTIPQIFVNSLVYPITLRFYWDFLWGQMKVGFLFVCLFFLNVLF